MLLSSIDFYQQLAQDRVQRIFHAAVETKDRLTLYS